jgi:ADP-heptose:LPS heptosyltransferase
MSQENILVIKLGALGDFIYALGPMAAIRKHHNVARVTLLTTKPFEKMGRECGYFDDVIVDKKPKYFDIFGWLSLRKTLNQGQFSRVYDLQNNDRTEVYLKLFSPCPEWVGAAKGASHRNASPERVTGHAFLGHTQTLALGGIENVVLDPLLWMKGEAHTFALLPPYVLIVPGCSPTHPEKRWPVEHYRTVIAKLVRHGYQAVILGTKDDAEATGKIMRGFLEKDVVDLTGRTSLFDIPDLARGAVVAIGNDTGPMHICAVTGCPVVMFFSNQTSSIIKHAPPKSDGVFAFERDDLKDISAQMAIDAFFVAIGKKENQSSAG